jgi:hypothetical protein
MGHEMGEPIATDQYFVRIQKSADTEGVLIFPIGTYWRDGKKRKFTRKDAQTMVRNFDADILERRPPVNMEHERVAGRVGHVTRLWVADDGVRGKVEPVAGQEAALGLFDYVSPEVRWKYQHPLTGAAHSNVLMGLALTNYPYLLGRMNLHGVRVWTAKGDWEQFDYATVGDAELYALYEALRKEA